MDRRQQYISGYLQSPEWNARSKRYRIENGSWCRACRQGGKVDVHHLDHSRLRGQEPDSALIALCRPHHDLAHKYWGSGKYRTRRDATYAMIAYVQRRWNLTSESPLDALVGALLQRRKQRGKQKRSLMQKLVRALFMKRL